MKLPHRRHFLPLAAGVAAPALPRTAWAQIYPTRPVRLIVGFEAGGAADILARLMGKWLSERLGQQFVIENRGGAGGNIAAEAVARAAPDGYTLLLLTSTDVINAALYEKLNFDFIRDIVPVASITRTPHVMVVHPSFPVKTVPEFIAFAKANQRKVNMASAGFGTPSHMSASYSRRWLVSTWHTFLIAALPRRWSTCLADKCRFSSALCPHPPHTLGRAICARWE